MTNLRTIFLLSASLAGASFTAAMPTFANEAYNEPSKNDIKNENAALRALFAADDEASLKRNPLGAIFRGDLSHADQLGDYISDAYYDAERAATEENLTALAKINRANLGAVEQIAYDVFKRSQESLLTSLSDEILPLNIVRPVNHFTGFHTFYPTFSSGQGAAPFNTLVDYENNLKRHTQFIALSDASIERFREGMESGVFETQLTIKNVIEQLDTQLAQSPEESPYFGPTQKFPDTISEDDRVRLTRAYKDVISDGIYPAYERMRDFLRDEYLPLAREGVGLSYMKGGAALYEFMIEESTTLPLKADAVHQLGLSEVARITANMEAIKEEVNFEGSLSEFFDFIRTDEQFKPKSREGLTQRYYDVGKLVDAKISEQFKVLPKSGLEIKPYEPFREKFSAGGSYQSGTPDGSRAGIFYFNAYDLPSRTTPGITTLYLHEGAPGHHFQISLAQENESLPAFMRFGGNTAYVEGWALYAETLGYDMGLLDDPYQRFGQLDDEMLRAMRLVVDTGLHSKQWTREQAIKYMLDNSSMGETAATSEVERYIAIPTQALAYKIGALTIQRLKAEAQASLGDKFDVRDFHDQVLNTGALPLSVLESKIRDWTASQK